MSFGSFLWVKVNVPAVYGHNQQPAAGDHYMSETNFCGVVNPTELYTLEAMKQRLGIRDATLRAARRAGLRIYYKHGRGFVYGNDWITYICSPKNDGLDA